MAFASRTSCARERPPRGHVQDVPRTEPANRQDGRIVGRLDRQAAVGRERRDRLGLECCAPEELPQRRLQEIIVERAGREDGRKRHELLDHNSSRMPRRTLIDFFDDLSSTRPRVPRLRRRLSHLVAARYADEAARRARLRRPASRRRHRQGTVVVIWSENRPEWIVAFWGCLLEGVVLVPIDYRTSCTPSSRASPISSTPAPFSSVTSSTARRSLAARSRSGRCRNCGARPQPPQRRGPAARRANAIRDDADGRRHRRDHLHVGRDRRTEGRRHHARNILANIVPIEKRGGEVPALREAVPADPLPQPAAAQPHVRPGDGDVRSADAARARRLHAQLLP